MRENKLFKAVKGVDDDLICEMLEYRPKARAEIKGDEYEGELIIIPEGVKARQMWKWKYPITAAAALAIAGGALFVINHNGGFLENTGGAAGGETVQTVVETDNGEASTAGDTDTVGEETEPAVSEAVQTIVPLKKVNVGVSEILYTDLYPEYPKPNFDEEYFKEMSTFELLEYYGLEGLILEIKNGTVTEVTDGKLSHGIYTLPGGTVYDINTFTFETRDFYQYGKKFTVTIGKESIFGQEYKWQVDQGSYTFYNEEQKTFFRVINKFGSNFLVTGKVDELSNFDDKKTKEEFYFYSTDSLGDEYWKGVPYEMNLFLMDVYLLCLTEAELR